MTDRPDTHGWSARVEDDLTIDAQRVAIWRRVSDTEAEVITSFDPWTSAPRFGPGFTTARFGVLERPPTITMPRGVLAALAELDADRPGVELAVERARTRHLEGALVAERLRYDALVRVLLDPSVDDLNPDPQAKG